MMTDQELSDQVSKTSIEFCKALNAAGKAGLQIEVKFSATERADGGGQASQVTGWRSHTKLSRVLL